MAAGRGGGQQYNPELPKESLSWTEHELSPPCSHFSVFEPSTKPCKIGLLIA